MIEHYYASDAGSIAVGTEKFRALYPNGVGDGSFSVFILNYGEKAPTNLTFISSVEGFFNIYFYDCAPLDKSAGILESLFGRYGIYHDANGNIFFEKWN